VSGCSPIVYRHIVKVIALPTFSYLVEKERGERKREDEEIKRVMSEVVVECVDLSRMRGAVRM
jgi:hypothetical protein